MEKQEKLLQYLREQLKLAEIEYKAYAGTGIENEDFKIAEKIYLHIKKLYEGVEEIANG